MFQESQISCVGEWNETWMWAWRFKTAGGKQVKHKSHEQGYPEKNPNSLWNNSKNGQMMLHEQTIGWRNPESVGKISINHNGYLEYIKNQKNLKHWNLSHLIHKQNQTWNRKYKWPINTWKGIQDPWPLGKMQIKAVGMSVIMKTNTGKNAGQGASYFPLVGKAICALTMEINMEIQERWKRTSIWPSYALICMCPRGSKSAHLWTLLLLLRKRTRSVYCHKHTEVRKRYKMDGAGDHDVKQIKADSERQLSQILSSRKSRFQIVNSSPLEEQYTCLTTGTSLQATYTSIFKEKEAVTTYCHSQLESHMF